MKKILPILLFITTMGYSHILKPVKWTTATKKISETEYDLIFTADIEATYHLYSQKIPDNGPRPTAFIFEESNFFELIGNVKEDNGHTVYDPTFKMKIKYFDTKATLKQRIKIKNESNSTVNCEIEFMTCNNSNCVLGYEDVELTVN
ncbi:protein-disulfide reductase DsbD domain-containing protein [Mangrovimonas sp. ST2L15]|uniref:protein-disulfide reductase DsbD domain-containing protein n=1 Tax=Mangrovimonas sp. ST2L15 TaxID=1645916 RepID=UPI0006B64415|nr:protein-disulfide reductase DsbD domain-containing protein [Mangrovimonas sp. ST2L15]